MKDFIQVVGDEIQVIKKKKKSTNFFACRRALRQNYKYLMNSEVLDWLKKNIYI